MADRHDDPAVLAGLLDHSPYVVMRVDGAGTITWVNAAVERLFERSIDSVLGTNVVDYLDLTWDASALASIGDAMVAEGLRLPTYFRVVVPDGPTGIFEVWANAQLHDPTVEGLVVYLRPWDERTLLDRALEAMIGGEPLAQTLAVLVASMAFETLEADGAIVHGPTGDGFVASVAGEALRGTPLAHPTGPGPWARAVATGEPAAAAVDELTGPVAAAAAAAGFGACWAWPVRDDDGGVAGCVLAWRPPADTDVDHSRREMMERLARVAGLAISRAAQVSTLHHAATHDPLTGLANRAHFYASLEALTAGATEAAVAAPGADAAGTHPLLAVLYLDLDGFKAINDRLGHTAGDQVLVHVARRLDAGARRGDLVARLGGDEFAVLCPRVGATDELDELAARLQAAVVAPITLGDEEVSVGVSTGIAVRDPRRCSADELVEAADAALYRVKFGAKGGWALAGPAGPGETSR